MLNNYDACQQSGRKPGSEGSAGSGGGEPVEALRWVRSVGFFSKEKGSQSEVEERGKPKR